MYASQRYKGAAKVTDPTVACANAVIIVMLHYSVTQISSLDTMHYIRTQIYDGHNTHIGKRYGYDEQSKVSSSHNAIKVSKYVFGKMALKEVCTRVIGHTKRMDTYRYLPESR